MRPLTPALVTRVTRVALVPLVALGLAGCTKAADTAEPAACGDSQTTAYNVSWSTAPALPIAGEEATFTLQITDQDACPIEDLQQNHERMVHTLFISRDLEAFQHLHQEDSTPVTADNLREATYSFPVTFDRSGPHHLVFDFAHQNAWFTREGDMEVGGGPPQLDGPAVDLRTEVSIDDLTATLTWDVPPVAGYEAIWTVSLTDLAGVPVTDVTPWLGADAHAAVVQADLSWVTHTHAWFPGMDSMAPGMEMPHQYNGPDLPFHYVMPAAGLYKMWVQLRREADPDHVYAFPFLFEVAG